MKRALYNRHVYSGKKVHKKGVKSGGIQSRNQLWRNVLKENLPQSEYHNTESEIPGHKTYAKPSKMRFEAPLQHSTSPQLEPNPIIETSTNWPILDPEIDQHTFNIEPDNTIENYPAKGKRVVDIQHILKWSFDMSKHQLKCTLSKINLIKEIRKGFHSTFLFKCNVCNKTWTQTSEPEKNINEAFVWGTLTSGSYYTQVAQIFSTMDVPVMSSITFRKIEVKLGRTWDEHLTAEIHKAGKEEKEIAIKKGNVNAGIPFITVYVDGGWSKRSYGHNYNAASEMIIANTKLPLSGRKLLKPRLSKLSIVARKIIIDQHTNKQQLRKDLRNSIIHVFGEHEDCASYYCKWRKAKEESETITEDVNVLTDMKKEAEVWSLICSAIEAIVLLADRLSTETTNVAENLMMQLAKFNCGKRICFTKRGSFQRRAQLAGLAQSCGNRWQEQAWEKAMSQKLGVNFKTYLQRLEKLKARQKNYVHRRTFQKPTVETVDKDYGPIATNPPPIMNGVELKEECEAKLKTFQLSVEEIKSIEGRTRGQFDSDLYKTLRADRLTASLFGMIYKRRLTTPCHNHVKTILYAHEFETLDTKEGKRREPLIRDQFERKYGKVVRNAGLFIDQEYGFLAASPDGVVEEELALVEIKSFPSLQRWAEQRKISTNIMEQAIKEKKDFPLKIDDSGTLYLNKKHNHYYQVQGQLRVTGFQKCYYVAQSVASEDIVVVEVDADKDFIDGMVQKLVAFYQNCVVPELVLRRHNSGYLCLDPPQILEAIKGKLKTNTSIH